MDQLLNFLFAGVWADNAVPYKKACGERVNHVNRYVARIEQNVVRRAGANAGNREQFPAHHVGVAGKELFDVTAVTFQKQSGNFLEPPRFFRMKSRRTNAQGQFLFIDVEQPLKIEQATVFQRVEHARNGFPCRSLNQHGPDDDFHRIVGPPILRRFRGVIILKFLEHFPEHAHSVLPSSVASAGRLSRVRHTPTRHNARKIVQQNGIVSPIL